MKPASCSYYRTGQIAFLVVLFVASRGVAFSIGMRYPTAETRWLWQLLDLDILHHHLLRGLMHLHAQPPLYNALVGVAEKSADSNYGVVLIGLQSFIGLAAVLSIYATLVRLRVNSVLRIAACAFLILNPAAIAYEFDPLYTQLVYALLSILMFATICFIQDGSKKALGWLIVIGVCLTLVRASFQWIWLGGMLATLWWHLPKRRRLITRFGAIGLLLTLLWPAKNYILFHHFSSSTWLPYSMSRHWDARSVGEKYQTWIKQGLVPTMSMPINDESKFVGALQESFPSRATGDPELDDLRKQTGDAVNWNSLSLLKMHDAQSKDVVFLLRHAPIAYAKEVVTAVGWYFEPTSEYFAHINPWSMAQYRHFAREDRILRRICCNPFGLPPVQPESSITIPAITPLKEKLMRICVSAVIAYGLLGVLFISLKSNRFWSREGDRKIFAAAMLFTPAYLLTITSLLEVGENMRFRFESQAIVTVLVLVLFQQYLGRRSQSLACEHEEDSL
jgi:hypothetical protein